MAAAKQQTLTFTEIRVMDSEKQPGIWVGQKRSSLIREFNHLSPVIQSGLEEGSKDRKQFDYPLHDKEHTIYPLRIVNPQPTVDTKPIRHPEPISFTEFRYLLPIINFGPNGGLGVENEDSGPSQQRPEHNVTELNFSLGSPIENTHVIAPLSVVVRPEGYPDEPSRCQGKLPSLDLETRDGSRCVLPPRLAAEPLEPNSRALRQLKKHPTSSSSNLEKGPDNPKSRRKRHCGSFTPPPTRDASSCNPQEALPPPGSTPKRTGSQLLSELKNRLTPHRRRGNTAQESNPPSPVFKPPSTARSWSSTAQSLRKVLSFKMKKDRSTSDNPPSSGLAHTCDSTSSETLKAGSNRSFHSQHPGASSTASNTPTGKSSILSSISRQSSRTSRGQSYHASLEDTFALQKEPRPFQCTFCLEQCEEAEDWVQHEQSFHVHKSMDDWFWECGFCGILLHSWDERQEHIIGEHFNKGTTMFSWNPLRSPSPLMKRFGTPAPGFPYWDKTALFALQKLTLSDSSKSQRSGRDYRCKICNIEFSGLSTHMEHTDLWHCSTETWSCPSLAHDPPLDAFFRPTSPDSAGRSRDECICCEQKFYTRPLNMSLEARIQHLRDVHYFNECAHEEMFFRKEYFHLHLANAHNIGDFGSLLNFIDSRTREERAPASMI